LAAPEIPIQCNLAINSSATPSSSLRNTRPAGSLNNRIIPRRQEMRQKIGEYEKMEAAVDYHKHLLAIKTDNLQELTYQDRKRIHNLKYYTWIEQQGMELNELNAQWYDYDNYWGAVHKQTKEIDELINKFNKLTGL